MGKTVLVTGAASGIGRATAERLLGEGATVVGVDLAPGAIEGGGDRYRWVAADVRDDEAVGAAVAAAVGAGGRLDGGVHAAGVAGGSRSTSPGRTSWPGRRWAGWSTRSPTRPASGDRS